MIIYKATNKMNGKVYIGKTSSTLNQRRWEHYNRAKLGWKQYFYHVIRKYGEDSFLWEIIDEAKTDIELSEKEIYWINHFNSCVFNNDCNGYNMTIGGEGTSGYKFNEEQKKARSKRLRGRGNPMYGYSFSDEQIERLRNRDQCGANALHVLQLDKNGNIIAEHKSITEASKAVGGDKSGIVKCCKGASKTHKGFIWVYNDSYDELDVLSKVKNARELKRGWTTSHRKVIKLTLDGDFVGIFDKLSDGAKSVSGYGSSISECCNGKKKQYKGFRWVYAEDYEGDYNE